MVIAIGFYSRCHCTQANRCDYIPTLLSFRAGKEIACRSGAMDTSGLTRWMKSVL